MNSDLGTQLDSLADMVTSGLVPGIAMYQMLYHSMGLDLYESRIDLSIGSTEMFIWEQLVPYFGFLITLGSCYRLAKFNIDTRQTDSFIGLPTPANAILILSIGIIIQTGDWTAMIDILSNPYFLIILTVASCLLLNAELPLFALKSKTFGFKGNELRWLFILACILLIVFLKIYAVPCIIVLYVALSIINNTMSKSA